MSINILDLKKTKYKRALYIQQRLQNKRIDGTIDDTLILVEHPPVITMGKRSKQNNVLVSEEILSKENIETVWINRGGEATYHGPGQLVVYPIMHLTQNKMGIKIYIEKLQQTIVGFLEKEYGITAQKQSGVHTGVWVGDKKVCAIGVAVSRNVTMHGLAFNINTNLKHFAYINPCGLGQNTVTSLNELIGKKIDFEEAKKKVSGSFCEVFNATPRRVSLEKLLGDI